MVTTGGIHGLYIVCQALLEPGDEVIVPDPEWPPCVGNIRLAHGVPVPCPLHESLGWRFDLDELASKITPEDARDLHQLAAQPHRRRPDPRRPRGDRRDRRAARPLADLGRGLRGRRVRRREHVSPASLPGDVRTDDVVLHVQQDLRDDRAAARLRRVPRTRQLRERMKKVLFYTASNVASVVQFGGIGALEGSQDVRRRVPRRAEGAARSVLRTASASTPATSSPATPPTGAFYAFLRIDPAWTPPVGQATARRCRGR